MRKCLAALACAAMLAILLLGFRHLPGVGLWNGVYGTELNHASIPERCSTNTVSAVNFDYRSLDTLGEETMLFAAVAALTLLLREKRQVKSEEKTPRRPHADTTPVVRLLGLFLLPAVMVFGVYLALHAQTTPGGGFQGGAVLGTALLQVYLVSKLRVVQDVLPEHLAELMDAGGNGLYAVAGVLGLAVGGSFLQNVLPLGTPGAFFSGGLIMVVNLGVMIEVSSGFSLMLKEFLEQPFNREPETEP